jgi:hypothetical protein
MPPGFVVTKERSRSHSHRTPEEDCVRNDRAQDHSYLYDRKKYSAMLREAFEPFVLCVPKRAEPVLLSDSISEDDLKRFPLFSALAISRL